MATLGHEDEASMRTASFAAGLTAGVARVWVGHPFDTLKVMRQTGVTPQASHEWLRPSLATVKGLYRGCGPPLVSVGFYTSSVFGIYETVRAPVEERLLRSRRGGACSSTSPAPASTPAV
ncbi:unnamed protein product, partial [Polarella glacialis]